MNNSNPVFRKTVFGGFNREDVINYIENLKNEFHEYKTNTDNIINGLYEKINSLNVLLEESSAQLENARAEIKNEVNSKYAVSNSFCDVSKVADDIKSVADLLCVNFEDLLKLINSINLQKETDFISNTEDTKSQNESDFVSEKSSFFDDILSKAGKNEKSANLTVSKEVSSQFEDFFKL